MKRAVPVIEFPPHEGYPADYLVARLGGRRSLMIGSWEAFIMAGRPALPPRYADHIGGQPDEAIARALRRELWWVARQMDNGLREIFRPVFVYFELGTLFSCVRYKSRKDADETLRTVLEHSLVSRQMKAALMGAVSPGAAFAVIEKAFALRPGTYGRTPGGERMSDAEQRLTDTFLRDSAVHADHPAVKGFFRTVIDMRNIVSIYKRLRWGIEKAPPVIEGGNIGFSRLRGIVSEGSLLSAIRKFTGFDAERPSEAENLFIKRLLAYSKSVSRQFGAVGAVLHYLLRCHQEARNLSLIFTGGVIERDFLRGELVI